MIMKNNKLIIYKKSLFKKIRDFFKKIFSKKEVLQNEDSVINKDKNNSFINNIQIKRNKEELRLLKLRKQYENGEINEEDMSNEDIDKLCEMYKKETDELNADTEKRKKHIEQMLNELKNY